MRTTIFFLLVLTLFTSCDTSKQEIDEPQNASELMAEAIATANSAPDNFLKNNSFEDLVEAYESKTRSEWQKPELVLNYLGDVRDLKVADIGAGTGYFSFRLLDRGADVIATEIDERFVTFLQNQIGVYSEEVRQNFEIRHVDATNSGLDEEEVDAILIVNTIAYIDDRTPYLKNLKEKLKPNGKLVVVDYKMKRIPVPAPSLAERTVLGYVEEDIMKSGFNLIASDDTSLDFQWIILAEKKSD